MITIYIKSASMTGIMMPYLLHRLQFTNVQKGKTILLFFVPATQDVLPGYDTAAAVSSPSLGIFLLGQARRSKWQTRPSVKVFSQSVMSRSPTNCMSGKVCPASPAQRVEIGRTGARV